MNALVGAGLGKRAILGVLTLLSIAFFFWLDSRYPQINDKALMGGEIHLQDSLSFEAEYELDPQWPLLKRIGYSTLNWIFTNRRGMIFGILFGAAFLTFLRYLSRKSVKNGFANAAVGLVIGAPLGVCVNCAAPVGLGLYNGGTRAETTLAAMIASPTFNIIVLTMVVSLFPMYMVATKIFLTLVLILLVIPLVCRLMSTGELQLSDADACLIDPPSGAKPSEGIGRAIIGFLSDYARDFWFIVRLSVPLMFAAGLLGSVMATVVPFETLADLPVNIFTLTIVALLGVIAPVPMAFDVILAAIMLNAGVPIAIVMTLLFTLGAFSIYSFIIVGRAMSMRTAGLISAAIVVLGIAGGYTAEAINQWQLSRALNILQNISQIEFISSAHAQTSTEQAAAGGDNITVDVTAFAPKSAPFDNADTLFSRVEGWHLGVDRPNRFSMAEFVVPYSESAGSVSAADMDNDGDADIVMALLDSGIHVFLNDGTGHFALRPSDFPELDDKSIFNAAPVDLNNDGWLDMVVTTDLDGNFIYMSKEGAFSEDRKTLVENTPDAILTLVVGFGDLDRDGYLDVALGNRMLDQTERGYAEERNRNRVVFNQGGSVTGERYLATPGPTGDTLSVLISDFNQDGFLDLIEANDVNRPDMYSFGDGRGGLSSITKGSEIIPASTHTTMSIKTADLDNNGTLEIYLSQITGRSDGIRDRLTVEPASEYCKRIERDEDRAICQKNIDQRGWYSSGIFGRDPGLLERCDTLAEADARECRAMALQEISVTLDEPSLCVNIPDDQMRLRRICEIKTSVTLTSKEAHEAAEIVEIPQLRGRNILYSRADSGKFIDRTEEAALALGGWSWDVKIYDFDHDGFQDIYILNGVWGLQNLSPSNVYFTNKGGLVFEDTTEANGLIEYLITPGGAAADFDGDGDVDMVANPINGPAVIYMNNSQTGNRIAFELRDHIGNLFGIGGKIKIIHGADDREQLRELQLSGGYASFDAPIAYFGLADDESVDKIEIEWSTGETSLIDGPFEAGAKYTLTRHPAL